MQANQFLKDFRGKINLSPYTVYSSVLRAWETFLPRISIDNITASINSLTKLARSPYSCMMHDAVSSNKQKQLS